MRRLAALSIAVLSFATAVAQHQTFTLDPSASEVRIKLNTTHEVVNGTFHVESGTIAFDRTPPQMDGQIVVVAGSGNTGNGMRDKRMTKDILKADRFTSVSFSPKTYTGTLAASGDSTIQVTGVFTLLGTPHDLTVPLQIHIDGTHATAKAQFTIPYVQWGLKNPSFLIWKVENDVALTLNLVGEVSK